MNKEKSPTKVFVFIARDKAEYDKYFLESSNNDTSGARSDSPENGRSQWRFSSKLNILRVVVEKGCLGLLGWKCLQPQQQIQPHSQIKVEDLRLADLLDLLRKDSKNSCVISAVRFDVKELFCSGLVDGFLKKTKCIDGTEILDSNNMQCRIFIHWGGGQREQVLFYEREVSKRLQPLLPTTRLYSLGTNRNDIFNIDRVKILIPARVEELDALDEKFYNEQRFAGAMSDGPLSLAASCTRDKEIIITEHERNAVFLRIENLKDRILTSSLETQVKNDLLIEISAAMNDFKGKESANAPNMEVKITVDDKTARLARKMLNKEVFNG